MLARPSHRAIVFFTLLLALFALTFADAAHLRGARGADRAETGRLAARLGLTDLALFTEARYTRHLSQADLHSAFQDHPMAMEHFPSGALTTPRPPAIGHEYLDRKTESSD